jgi:hypothetical protein
MAVQISSRVKPGHRRREEGRQAGDRRLPTRGCRLSKSSRTLRLVGVHAQTLWNPTVAPSSTGVATTTADAPNTIA